METDLPLSEDDALEAILALHAVWRRKSGRVTLGDILWRRPSPRARGGAALPPERWRESPGAKPAHLPWVVDV